MDKFIKWLEQQIADRRWQPSDLAHAAHLPDATISNILNQKRKAGPDACNAIARALELPSAMVFRKAGLLPDLPGPEEDVTFGELLEVVEDLSVEERAEVLEYALLRRRLQQKRKDKPAPNTSQ